MMQGNIWISSNPQGLAQGMTLVLKFQIQPSFGRSVYGIGNSSEQPNSNSIFECLTALTHSEAAFQIILMDLQMPEMDGFEVAKRIRKFRSQSWPLIIALTASADEHLWEKCLQAGMNGIIRKPVLLQGMADELIRLLNRANDGV